MSSIENELREDFGRILLEMLVPLAVQRQMPQIKQLWQGVVDVKECGAAFENLFRRSVTTRRSVAETLRLFMEQRDDDLLQIKSSLYKKVGRSEIAIREFFGRPITNGNEQCPYWDRKAYTEAPVVDLER
jgi:hypothetical protein